jgi:hypothetical protein
MTVGNRRYLGRAVTEERFLPHGPHRRNARVNTVQVGMIALHPDDAGPSRFIVLVEPVGKDQARGGIALFVKAAEVEVDAAAEVIHRESPAKGYSTRHHCISYIVFDLGGQHRKYLLTRGILRISGLEFLLAFLRADQLSKT